ncbi:PREDICTED: uncharacterized protein LOC105449638 isoform X2 [Wasmannia auropunctata]|nr:PREDICTED: uncharacterized protein LOC105449638 isoform X2 [Wasmannia auropunctata]
MKRKDKMASFDECYCTDNEACINENENNQIFEHSVESSGNTYDELLIDSVKNFPNLYDHSLKEFKDLKMRENSWLEIANILHISVKTCKNRWICLRDRFTKEMRKIETQIGRVDIYRIKFPLFDKMLFLQQHIKRRKGYSRINPTVEKQLIDMINIYSSNFNEVTSNASSSNQTIPSNYSEIPNTDFNENLPHVSPDNIQLSETSTNFILTTPSLLNIQSDTHQTENVIETNTPLPSPQDETYSFSGMAVLTNLRDSIPKVSRDPASRDSVSRDSALSDLVSRDSSSPALQTLPINKNTDPLNKINKRIDSCISDLFTVLDDVKKDTLQDVPMTNQSSDQMVSNSSDELIRDEKFNLLIAAELKKMPTFEKKLKKQAILSILDHSEHFVDKT